MIRSVWIIYTVSKIVEEFYFFILRSTIVTFLQLYLRLSIDYPGTIIKSSNATNKNIDVSPRLRPFPIGDYLSPQLDSCTSTLQTCWFSSSFRIRNILNTGWYVLNFKFIYGDLEFIFHYMLWVYSLII